MINNARFNQSIKQTISTASDQAALPGYGMILDYDANYNTATVVMAAQGSGGIGEVYKDVPCPTTSGVQQSAPTPGQPVWVVFKDNVQTYPVITNFFNHVYNKKQFLQQSRAVNNTPRFIYDM